jgi:hypothetical protein
MKKTARALALLLALAAFACLLCACGGGKGVRNDVPVEDVAAAVDKAIGGEKYNTVDEVYIGGRLQVDLTKCEGYVVRLNVVDEYGVFKAKDADAAKELEKEVRTYLINRLATWMDEYMPEEKPKVENAECRVFGNYVTYAILSDSDRAAAFKAIDAALK